jgi:hypothetical protein
LVNYRSIETLNSEEFFDYIKMRFDEKFAIFLCNDLKMMSAAVLQTVTVKQIEDLVGHVQSGLSTTSIEFYDDEKKIKCTVLVQIKLLKEEFSNEKKKKRKCTFNIYSVIRKSSLFLFRWFNKYNNIIRS